MHGGRPPAYTAVARTIHWIVAALVLGTIPIGIVMANMGSGPRKDALYHLHESIGIVVLMLMIVRLGYRLTHPPLPLPEDIPAIQRLAAETTHRALYALLILQPIIGYIAKSAYPAPMVFFGLFALPPVWPENNALAETLFTVHRVMGFTVAGLLCAHIGGALFHQFIRRDDVLMRMIRG